ncbi:hypothetical protein QJS10_CPA01g02394 [Acorus calamus]|uniref:Reverse transcriptase domain-containing protein n=1 Tax=Acorus calamus TaxID=4465 RepID=A0AAV9FGE0_ACOCL|nr:hypothetical protein QJS10_CPA01g02394 [Acorus calamus]
MKALSSRGPDGFPGRFYQLFWPLIEEDLLKAINFFFQRRCSLRLVSHSFIALIPISLHVDSLDLYRPIYLCNTFYKIITKVMDLILQPIMKHLISHHQSAFIKDRSTHHNTLLAHELVKYLNQGKPRACIKVDLKKAFDSVHWNFLEKILRSCQFSDHWISLRMACVSSPQYSVLINGAPGGIFSLSVVFVKVTLYPLCCLLLLCNHSPRI